MSSATVMTWAEANQAHLIAEFARLKQRLGIPVETISYEPASHEEPFAIDRVAAIFGLTPFERDLLLLCAGVEMDSELAARCAELHAQKPFATFGLAISTLEDPHWSAFTPTRPLRRFRLLEVNNNAGF